MHLTYDLTGGTRETHLLANCSAALKWEQSGDALLPSPFLVYRSLCLYYNKQTCSIRLSLLILAAAEHHHFTPLVVAEACWSGNPEQHPSSLRQKTAQTRKQQKVKGDAL